MSALLRKVFFGPKTHHCLSAVDVFNQKCKFE